MVSDVETQLYTEIEYWDWSNEQAWLWTKIPTISSGIDIDIYLYYDSTQNDNIDYIGDTGSTPAQNVWNSNFKAVFHLTQDPTGGSNCILDSTSNNNHGTPQGSMTSDDLVDGKIGKALEFDGSNDWIQIDESIIDGLTALTVEALIYRTDSDNVQMFCDGIHWNENVSIDFGFGVTGLVNFSIYNSTVTYIRLLDIDVGAVQDQWVAFTGVFAANDYIKCFKDGIEKGYLSHSVPSVKDEDNNLCIGRSNYGGGSNYYGGKFCEFRLSNIDRSTAWVIPIGII